VLRGASLGQKVTFQIQDFHYSLRRSIRWQITSAGPGMVAFAAFLPCAILTYFLLKYSTRFEEIPWRQKHPAASLEKSFSCLRGWTKPRSYFPRPLGRHILDNLCMGIGLWFWVFRRHFYFGFDRRPFVMIPNLGAAIAA